MGSLNTILSFVIILGQVGMFFFFKQQLKSKNRVIDDLQTLVNATDIKRLVEYNDHRNKLVNEAKMAEINLELTHFTKDFHLI